MGEALYIVQDDHRPLAFRQLPQPFFQPRAQFSIHRRIAKRRCHRFRQRIRVAHLPPPADIQRRVCHYPIQPRPERLVGPKPVESAIRMQKGVLNRVLGIFPSEGDRPRYRKRPRLVEANECRECLTASALRLDYQAALVLPPLLVSWRGMHGTPVSGENGGCHRRC
jgi:hypothetical protein